MSDFATQQRQRSQQEEFETQRLFFAKLRELLVPDVVFVTAIENKPRSRMAGVFQKRRGCPAGISDLLFVLKDLPSVWIELKSRKNGVLSPAQRSVFARLKGVGIGRVGGAHRGCWARGIAAEQRSLPPSVAAGARVAGLGRTFFRP